MPDLRTALRRLRERWACWRHGHVLEPDGVLARWLGLMVVQCSRCGRGWLCNTSERQCIRLSAKETAQKAAELRRRCDRSEEEGLGDV